tara:strand:+ start:165 stop:749 length:585 start_codon:yes stop_codon:yes gene_type:complete
MSSKPSAYELHQYLEHRRKPSDHLYAVVDGAQNYKLAVGSRDILGEPLRPLFVKTPHFITKKGPYLVRIKCTNRYPEYMKLWAEQLGTNTGMLFFSSAWPKLVREHLRTIFKVFDDQGAMFYFRFYDPRVLRTYLPTCTVKECREFFGPIRSIFAESANPVQMDHFQIGQSAIHLEEDIVQECVAAENAVLERV